MMTDAMRRRIWPALLLTCAMLAGGGAAATTLAGESEGEAEATGEAAEAVPSPTPVPTFDASAVRLRLDLFASGLADPVAVVDDGTGSTCVYIVERGGTVRIINPFSGELNPRPFLSLDKVAIGAELGLHSIAFHPDFKKNGRFFAHYNRPKAGEVRSSESVIAEFRGRPCKPSNSKPVKPLRLVVEQPLPNNNGGWLAFGPDGFLYVGLGDGGGVSPGDPNGIGQSKKARLSKILRLDVDRGRGAVPPKTNPFAKKRQGFDPLTWAYGLRDPRHASFDPATGDLWIADTGQDRFEEVNRIPAGSIKRGGPVPNFGWSDMEGDQCHNLPACDPSQYTLPVHFYDKVPPQGGITGGFVYRGEALPELRGVYVFSDRISGFIWGLDADAVAAGQPVTAQLLLDAPQGITALGQDDSGELYAIAADSSIFRIDSEEA